MEKRIILVFGHLPKYVGGNQTSGLANVMWNIANNINRVENLNYKVIFVSTDIHDYNKIIDKTEVRGWSVKQLLKYIFFKPDLFFYYMYKALKLKNKYNFSFLNNFIKLIFYHKSIYEIRPDLIHLHGCFSVVFFAIIGIKRFKIFATIHGLSGQDKLIPGYKDCQKMEQDFNTLPLKFVAFISHDLILKWNSFYGKPQWPMKVILNAYDGELFYLNKNETIECENKTNYLIATIASVSLLKGQNRVLEALSTFDSKNIKYICIGDGKKEDIESLKKYAKDKDISFEYLGFRNPAEIREFLKCVDFMVLPSSSEGFGLTFLECIACGVPVILPKALPIAKEENLLNSTNSLFLDDEYPKSIAKVLSKLNEYNFSRDLVSKSVTHCSWPNIAMQYIDSINELMSQI